MRSTHRDSKFSLRMQRAALSTTLRRSAAMRNHAWTIMYSQDPVAIMRARRELKDAWVPRYEKLAGLKVAGGNKVSDE